VVVGESVWLVLNILMEKFNKFAVVVFPADLLFAYLIA